MVLPPNMNILVRGTAAVLALTVAVSGITGLASMDAVVALNAAGFIGTCALSVAAIYYAVALERVGLRSARKAATSVIAVLAGAAVAMTLLFFLLVSESRFQDEAARFGLQSVAGILVLVVLATVLAMIRRDR